MGDLQDVVISRVGAQGDGVAETGNGSVFVPYTLAGERVRCDVSGERGVLHSILTASEVRIAAVCRHFGTCGGCAVQHMAPEAYRTWKRELVVAAFAARGIDAQITEMVVPKGRRRRAAFTVERQLHGVELGFRAAGSHDLVDVSECPVLEPKIVNALPGLRALVAPLMAPRAELRMGVTLTKSGLDVTLEGIKRKLSPDVRTRIAMDAAALNLARVSVEGEPVYQAVSPVLKFGPAEVAVPPGIFVQANGDAEAAIAALIVSELGKVKSVADLFSGVGAFTFPISVKAKVSAFDSDASAIAALAKGVKTATGIKPVTARVRDLFREPLSAMEINEFDAVVFDPPRAGADAQVRMLAKSKVKTVIAVSCNPATLARDARTLIDAGYRLDAVTPIDQFHYSAHVEAVAVFRR
jgi:23S rRNA (uracil1939-C5)-methyltransferase